MSQVTQFEVLAYDISKLIPDPKNARKHNKKNIEAIKGSLLKFSQVEPLVVNKRTGLLVGGHGRLEAMKELGFTVAKVVEVDLDEKEATALGLALNRTAELAEWDEVNLDKALKDLLSVDFKLGAIGFDDIFVKAHVRTNKEKKEENTEDDDPADKIPDIPKNFHNVELGQVWKLGRHTLMCGDSSKKENIEKLLKDNLVDAVVSDPPYGISFMNKKWDYELPSVEMWKQALEHCKPGTHALVACGTRTQHRMVVNLEDAGFEIRDVVSWIYGSGFPKSLNISKAIDKEAGAEREKGFRPIAYPDSGCWGVPNSTPGLIKTHGSVFGQRESLENLPGMIETSYPATDLAKQWDGWGTALKPACEFFTLCRKPISEDTVAKNVVKWGTGGINVDATRIGKEVRRNTPASTNEVKTMGRPGQSGSGWNEDFEGISVTGRWPANVLFDEEAAAVLDEQSGISKSTSTIKSDNRTVEKAGDSLKLGKSGVHNPDNSHKDSGGASRFFYVAKSSSSERNAGLENMGKHEAPGSKRSAPAEGRENALGQARENFHPTVKPIQLMKYLVTLITPPNGNVLEPFCGSGTTLLACEKLGPSCFAMEISPEYCSIIIERWQGMSGRKAELLNP